MFWNKKKAVFLLFLVTSIFVNGCAPVQIRTNPQFSNYFRDTKSITIMPVDLKVYKLTAGGVAEEMDEWENQAKSLVKQAVKIKLEAFPNIRVNVLEGYEDKPNFKEFLDEQNGLYRAVATSIITHTYLSGSIFPNKVKNFDYTLGSELSRINEFVPADSLLFINGSKSFWTGGRVMLATWGIVLGAFTGVFVTPGNIPDWISVALVDVKTGDIMWFRYLGAPDAGVGDVRNEEAVTKMIDYLFKDFVK